MCLDLLNIPALPDDPASSYWHDHNVRARERYKVPGSNAADAPMWSAHAAGDWKPADPDDPQPGYYLVRLVKRGPLIPCKIYTTLGCLVNGEPADPWWYWLQASKRPIRRSEYEERMAELEAIARHGL